MSRLYLLVPFALLALFAVPYFQHTREAATAAAAHAADLARQQQSDAAKKKSAELKAQADAAQRAAARQAAELSAAETQRAQAAADTARIAADTATYRAAADKLSSEITDLQTRLTAARAAHAKLNDEVFATSKTVELARIEKRTAELEIQRLTAMLARQAAAATLSAMPAPAP